jgi:hypothetical protein
MNKLILTLFLAIILINCQEHDLESHKEGKVSFSLSQMTRSNGRAKETATPAFVLLNVEDSHGQVQENIKLPLLIFGQSYISESLDLQIGNYRVTQFTVLDATSEVIYATPMEGSPLAQYVADPLPIDFTVTAEGVQVTTEVLAVVDTDEPELFGYASFGFHVVKVQTLQIPSAGADKILKVSYELSNGTERVKGEGIPANSILDLHNASLLEKTWETTLIVWMETEPCYQASPFQKIYRFEGSLTFDGSIKRLPSFTNESWGAFYQKEITFNTLGDKSPAQVFFPVNPMRSFLAEVHYPNFARVFFSRYYYDAEGNSICDGNGEEWEKFGTGRIQIRLADRTECEDNEFGTVGAISSDLSVIVGGERIETSFTWEVAADGSVKPYCL